MRTVEEDWDYSSYIKTDKKIQFPPKVIQYFKTLQQIINGNRIVLQNDNVLFGICNAFSKLSVEEKKNYIYHNLKYFIQLYENGKYYSNNNGKSYKLSKNSKITKFTSQKAIICCIYKQYQTIKLFTNLKTLQITQNYHTNTIHLKNYLVRWNKKIMKNTVVLESINEQNKNYEFFVKSSQFSKIYHQLFNCVMDIRNQQLISLISSSSQIKSQLFKSSIVHEKLINQQKYKQFVNQKKNILQNQAISYLKFQQQIHSQHNQYSYFTIKQNNNNHRLFKLQIFCNYDSFDVKQLFLSSLQQNKNELLIQSQIIEQYDNNCVILYQKYFLNQTPQTSLFIRQVTSLTNLLMSNSLRSIQQIEQKKRFQDFIFFKSYDNVIVDSFFNYLCVFVHPINNNQKYKSNLIVIGQFNLNSTLSVAMVKQFLCEFDYNLFNIKQIHNFPTEVLIKKQSMKSANYNINHLRVLQAIDRDQVKTAKFLDDSSHGNEKQIIIDLCQPQSSKQLNDNYHQISNKSNNTQVSKITSQFLQHQYLTQPTESYDLNDKNNIIKESFMGTQWIKDKNGALICVNEKLLSEHKKVFKHILTTIGSNIMKGGNILNVSLPVTIFKKAGHLQMIAVSFSLAPKLLQNVTDPIERMKKSVIISLAVGTWGITAQKPFFPFVGETLQVWIAGCPMYMEQILRYPPTGAYLLYGRGYKIYGLVQPKVGFGINGAKLYNDKPNFIQFDDGQKIQLSYSKISISGIFFGNRQFNFYDKNFVYDSKNNLFAQVIFGPKSSRFFNRGSKQKSSKSYFYGKIYKLLPQFAQKFNRQQSPKPYPSKKYIQSIVSQFEGDWDGVVSFDKKQYINFQTDFPHLVQNQQFPLPSDTRFRKDLIALINDNCQQSQKQKQILEDLQRRDRKLRTDHQKSKKSR